MKHERSSNFELLRLLCIFGILVMHTFAGIDTAASPGNMLANVFANSLFNTGVTCFILLSGYFGIRFDLKKLIGLDLMVIFFTVVGTVALVDFGCKDLIKSCIPVLSRRYWFITCYFVLCILAPFLNQMAERLEREHFRRLLLLLLLVFSLIPTVTTYDVMQDAGKGLAHFVMIYLLGRYLARYHTGHCSKKRLLLGITGSTALIFCADGALTLHQGVIYSTFSRDCSIFIIFSAVLLLLLFREFSLQSRIINRAATNVLAIYVLDQIIRNLLGRYLDLNAFSDQWYLFFVVCGYVLLVMLLAAVCNELRKLTIGRIEPWLTGIVAAFLQSCGALLVRMGQRIVHWFISMD